MLKRLSEMFSRKPQIDPADDSEPDAQLIEQAAAHKEAMEQFMRLVTRQLGDEESERLTNNVLAQFDGSEVNEGWFALTNFLCEGLLGEEGQEHGKWLMIQVDWKASEEIDWQVNEMLETRGIDDQWEWDSGGRTVMDGLKVLSDWLPRHALSLLSVDFGQDAYHMLIVDNEIAARVIETGQRAGVDVRSFQDFAVSQGEG
ncbi:DUF6630 family protein [Burkholderia sp. LMU1-1-1.1]|uniref:DUF6630 family protein n=1 Tax=Burkholderia sp. LMU1-1-1.1 TaxID=3135266 RepID=UPI0034387E30